jgi:hypothetical protein
LLRELVPRGACLVHQTKNYRLVHVMANFLCKFDSHAPPVRSC